MPPLSRKRKRKTSESTQNVNTDNSVSEVETGRTVDDSMNSVNGFVVNSTQNLNTTQMETDVAEAEDDVQRDENSVNEWADDMTQTSFTEPSNTQIERNCIQRTANETERARLNIAETGTLEAITLVNFMCHQNFHLDFGPRINFIVGRNGSGKSAVLNAIVVGLGCRTTVTNRGKSITSFIKSGETQAKIMLKICNESKSGFGKRGFQVDKYGPSIIVERTINISGSSTYKLKSGAGKTIAEKKEILDDMIRHFNIQVDNPICVLNQEVSRNFLNTKNPRDKYTFFMKATLLEEMKNNYSSSEADRLTSLRLLQDKKVSIDETAKDVKELERKVKLFNDLENRNERFTELNFEALWALVYEQRKKLESSESDFEANQMKIDVELVKVNEYKEKVTSLETTKEKKLERIENLVTEVQSAHALYEECKKNCDKVKDNYRQQESDERKKKAELHAIVKDKLSLEKKIEDLEQQFSNESHNNRKIEISRLKDKIEEMKNEEKTCSESLNDLRNTIQSMNEEKVHLNEEMRQYSASLSEKGRDIERLRQSKSEQIRRFGHRYPDLLKRIDEAHKKGLFKHKPLGPIGNHIQLKDYSCALAVELCLRYNLFAFCCDNMSDANTLKKIMASVFERDRPPPVVTRKFGPLHDVSRYRVEGGKYKSFLDLMSIKESPVANCLIDQLKIEQILFIPDYKEAEQLLINSSTVPHNCLQAYTSDGCVMYPNVRDSDYKCYANNTNKKNASILMKNVEQMLASLETELNYLETQKRDCDHRIRANNAHIEAKRRDFKEMENKIKVIRNESLRMGSKLRDLEAIGDSPPVEISTLEEELNKFNEQKTQFEQLIQTMREERKLLEQELTEVENDMKAKKADYDSLLNGRHPMREELENIKNQIKTSKDLLSQREKQLKDLMAIKTKIENEFKLIEEELKKAEEAAKKNTDKEIKTTRPSDKILNEIKVLEQHLREQESHIGDKDEIYAKYQQMSTDYKKLMKDVFALEKHLQKLKKSLNLRRRGYIELRSFYSMMTKFFFDDVLKHKGFSGSLDIYHTDTDVNGDRKKGKTLEIKVNPKSYDEGSQSIQVCYSDTRSLSGGERSYSTVAFILALWESAHSPFKILDEVDVFMDMITRKISLDALIEFASVKSGKQFIFLSPLKLQNLQYPDLIKIFQMPEPER